MPFQPNDILIQVGANVQQAVQQFERLDDIVGQMGVRMQQQLDSIGQMGFGDSFADSLKEDIGVSEFESAGELIDQKMAAGFTRNEALQNAIRNGFDPSTALAAFQARGMRQGIMSPDDVMDAGTLNRAIGDTAAQMSDNFRSNFRSNFKNFGSALPRSMELANTNAMIASMEVGMAELGQTADNGFQKASKGAKDMGQEFDFAALGVMFFGMQIQRVFGGIMRSSISTFNSVMGQLEDTTTATDRLSGAWKFLKFQIGNALQPVMAFLFPIVKEIGNWVSENQKLTRTIIVAGVAIGGLLTVIGALQLGFQAVSNAMTAGGFLYKGFTVFSGLVGGVSATVMGIAAAAAVGLGGLAYWMTQSDSSADAFGDSMSELGGDIKENQQLWSVLAGIGVFLKDILDVILSALVLLASGFLQLGTVIASFIVNGLQALWDTLEGLWYALKSFKDMLDAVAASVVAAFSGNWKAAQEAASEGVANINRAKDELDSAWNDVTDFGEQAKESFLAQGQLTLDMVENGGILGSFTDGRTPLSPFKDDSGSSSAPMSTLPDGSNMSTQPDKKMSQLPSLQKQQINEQRKTQQKLDQVNNTLMGQINQRVRDAENPMDIAVNNSKFIE